MTPFLANCWFYSYKHTTSYRFLILQCFLNQQCGKFSIWFVFHARSYEDITKIATLTVVTFTWYNCAKQLLLYIKKTPPKRNERCSLALRDYILCSHFWIILRCSYTLQCKGMKKVTFQLNFCRVRIKFSFSIWIHLRWLTPEGWDEIACPLAKLLLKPASPEKLCRLTNPLFRLHVFYIGKCYLTFGQWFVI